MSDEATPLPPLPQLIGAVPEDDDSFPDGPRTFTQSYRFPPAHSFPPIAECDRETLLAIASRAAGSTAYELVSAPKHMAAVCALLAYEIQPALVRADLELAALRADDAVARLRISTLEEAVRRERRTTLQELQRALAEQEQGETLRKELAVRDGEVATLRRENLELRRLVISGGARRAAAATPAPESDTEFDGDDH